MSLWSKAALSGKAVINPDSVLAFRLALLQISCAALAWLLLLSSYAVALALYAIATLFFHKWEWLTPANAFETAQLAVSKVLVFATISFMLVLAAKNYLRDFV